MSDHDPADAAPLAGVWATARWHAMGLLRLPRLGRREAWLLAGLALVAWLGSGIFKVGPDEQGVVLNFGRWVRTDPPGLHYHWPFPIGSILLPKVTKVNELRSPVDTPGSGARRVLTGDENLVEADYSVSWRIKDAGAYLFAVQDAPALVAMAAETALHEVIGRNPIQAALSDRRQQIAADAQDKLQHLLDDYGAGILVMQVQLQRVDPPAAVIDAFNDVQRARADQVRARNEAEAYRNDILPRARGEADHIEQDAEAYRTQALDQARGEVSAFQAAFKSYQQAPRVFAWRMYLDSMDDLLRHAARVVVDASGKGMASVLPYLPLGEPAAHPPAPALPPGGGNPLPQGGGNPLPQGGSRP